VVKSTTKISAENYEAAWQAYQKVATVGSVKAAIKVNYRTAYAMVHRGYHGRPPLRDRLEAHYKTVAPLSAQQRETAAEGLRELRMGWLAEAKRLKAAIDAQAGQPIEDVQKAGKMLAEWGLAMAKTEALILGRQMDAAAGPTIVVLRDFAAEPPFERPGAEVIDLPGEAVQGGE
jgi:hypothetical protein